jgi:hypothetical protein
MEQTRKEYIESEYKKWEEKFEIRFQDEFNLKAMIELQYQFEITPKEHIKTIGDIVHTKNQIMKNLNLKPKVRLSDSQKREYLFIAESTTQKMNIEELFLRHPSVENVFTKTYSTRVTTNEFKVHIVMDNGNDSLRGLRADAVFKLEDGHDLLYK